METLAAQITRDGRLGPPEAVGWIVRLAKCIEVSHRQGLILGNVSAYSLLVDGRSPLSNGTLIDAPKTPDPVYHSPERAADGRPSQLDDTWALAVTFFYALTGEFPFPGRDDGEVRQRALAGPFPQLSKLQVGDANLQQLLEQAFAREPGKRIADIASMRQSLERWARDPSLSALPPLDLDDEDEPTVMIPQSTVGSGRQAQEQQQAAGPSPMLGQPGGFPPMGANAGTDPRANALPAPLPAAGTPALLMPLSVQAMPPGVGPPPAMNFGTRQAATMLAVRPPAGIPKGTLVALVVIWFLVTFGGAAIEYVMLTRR